MLIDDIRRTVEGMLGILTPANAQRLAKDMMEPGAAKEQVANAAADLLEWSQANRERLSSFVRREIAAQLRSLGGIATEAELDALRKRVRDLERAAGVAASGRSVAKRPSAKRSTTKRSTAKRSTRTRSSPRPSTAQQAGQPPRTDTAFEDGAADTPPASTDPMPSSDT